MFLLISELTKGCGQHSSWAFIQDKHCLAETLPLTAKATCTLQSQHHDSPQTVKRNVCITKSTPWFPPNFLPFFGTLLRHRSTGTNRLNKKHPRCASRLVSLISGASNNFGDCDSKNRSESCSDYIDTPFKEYFFHFEWEGARVDVVSAESQSKDPQAVNLSFYNLEETIEQLIKEIDISVLSYISNTLTLANRTLKSSWE